MSQLLRIVDDSHKATRAKPVGLLSSYALRVSLLEQCSYNCAYCLPGSVNAFYDTSKWLSADEHSRLAKLFFKRGVRKIRFTGGEPLARKDVAHVIAAYKQNMPGVELALTTNGEKLHKHMGALKEAGLERVTVHLDTLREERYGPLMRGKNFKRVLQSIKEAAGVFEQVKLNAVVQKNKNDDELLDFVKFSKEFRVQVRFIELMNTGSANAYVEETFMSGDDIIAAFDKASIEAGFEKARPIARAHKSDPARLLMWQEQVFGLIASDTQPFCDDCDRLRLSAHGALKGCLYEPEGTPLRDALRRSESDDDLEKIIEGGLLDKRSFHPTVAIDKRPFSMADIGG